MSRKFTVWQCTDWCCDAKPHSEKWWNVSIAPGNYDSLPNWSAAMATVRSGRLRWSE